MHRNSGEKHKYTHEEIDYFACYNLQSNVASIMPVTGCYYNIKFSDIGKIDLKNLLDNERPSSRGLNAWIVEQK